MLRLPDPPTCSTSPQIATHLFVGPTLHTVEPTFLSRFAVSPHPPVKRGDIDALLREAETPGDIIIADGILTPGVAIETGEIERALAAGWGFWGVASTGAMLAAQMKRPGMRGFGYIFRCFLLEKDFSQDDIALLHSPLPPFTPFSEPLVHQRLLLEHLVAKDAISPVVAKRILMAIKQEALAQRTLERLQRLLIEVGALTEHQSREAVEQTLPRFRMKTRDLVKFIEDHYSISACAMEE